MKEHTSFWRFSQYENSIGSYLKDLSFFTKAEIIKHSLTIQKENLKNRIFKHIISLFGIFTSKMKFLHVWNPYDLLKLCWDIIFFILLTIVFFEIPMEIAFDMKILDLDLIIICMFVINIMISLNTAYYDRGHLVHDRKIIIKSYFKKYFRNDLLTILLYSIILTSQSNYNSNYLNFFKIAFYVNINRFFKIHKTLDEKFKLYYRLSGFLEIFELISFSFFIIHIFACGFYWISFIQSSDVSKSWLIDANVDVNEWSVCYLLSFYWATITIMTVGYGDITPKNSAERIFTILTAIVGCGVFAFNVSTVGRVFEKMNKDNEQFK